MVTSWYPSALNTYLIGSSSNFSHLSRWSGLSPLLKWGVLMCSNASHHRKKKKKKRQPGQKILYLFPFLWKSHPMWQQSQGSSFYLQGTHLDFHTWRPSLSYPPGAHRAFMSLQMVIQALYPAPLSEFPSSATAKSQIFWHLPLSVHSILELQLRTYCVPAKSLQLCPTLWTP